MAREKPDKGGDYNVPLLQRERMISKEELSEFLGVPLTTLDQWASRGGGPIFHRIGNHRKYWPADVREWLKTQRRTKSSDGRTSSAPSSERGAA